MESVLKNFEATVQLLALSHTDHVQQWDRETVNRAFKWARYCEHLLSRFLTNPSVRAALENRLHGSNQLLEQTFPGYRCLSLHDLTQCQHRLLVNLLQNPSAPHPLIRALLDQHNPSDAPIQSDLTALIACKSACAVLNGVPLDDEQLFSVETQVSGMMLLQRIHGFQSHPDEHGYARTLLDSVIGDSAGSDLIAAALLAANPQDRTQLDLVFDWLQTRPDVLHSMCQSLHSGICTKLSQLYQKFRLAYWEVLKGWMSSLEYDVSKGLWVQQGGNGVSFHTLREHIQNLWRSGSALKEQTEKEMMELKRADGNYEVQGLSVWTDVLLQLK